MRRLAIRSGRWWTVVVFAIAMAWMESAAVYYLRSMINRLEPYQPEPLPILGGFAAVELAREAATMIMLASVGILAGRSWRSRVGYAAIAFGVWDIFYYVFLRVMCGWPHTLLDWDVLFLIPLPWWGPVLAPVLIALLLIIWGTLVTQFPARDLPRARWRHWALSALGAVMALAVFMADTFRVSGQGFDAVRNVLPSSFPWPVFGLALFLMSAPVLSAMAHLTGMRRLGLPDEKPESHSPSLS